ncbi:hypothetical protein [Nostoc sp. PCC 7107]|uniref:hypothetical protein n=1 Tax=Nostoc sp. PCC 7107 TaxID=317936 RepID=UPI00029EF15F|nr:hypothetical protein [Nostoc sp. PCC 7107]AFY45759.1 hypothetical protein Nos7107_5261 [Nostoc sp. PCC 7107]
MEPTISIPKHWGYPSFTFGQRTKQGIIIGLQYHSPVCQLAHKYGYGWHYALMQHKHSSKVEHYSDEQLQALSIEEVKSQLQTEIDLHQLQVMMLQEQLTAIKKATTNG